MSYVRSLQKQHLTPYMLRVWRGVLQIFDRKLTGSAPLACHWSGAPAIVGDGYV